MSAEPKAPPSERELENLLAQVVAVADTNPSLARDLVGTARRLISDYLHVGDYQRLDAELARADEQLSEQIKAGGG